VILKWFGWGRWRLDSREQTRASRTLARPKTKTSWRRSQRIVLVLSLGYMLALLLLLAQLQRGPELHVLTLVNLYLPQILWAIPVPLLLLAGLCFCRKRPWIISMPLLPLLMVLGPLMGLRGYPSPHQAQIGAPRASLRVMTYNIASGRAPSELLANIAQERPDVVLLQELGPSFEASFRDAFPQWHLKSDGEFMIATRLPLSSVERNELPRLTDDPWKRPAYLRGVVQLGDTKIALYNTHLSTPRPALEALRERSSSALAQLQSNAKTRIDQASALAAALAQEPLPAVVGGDFNAPESSLVCQRLRQAGLRNAFSEAGKGYGYTSGHALRFGISFVRIDHIFVSSGWLISQCRPGKKTGSDHRPVVAVLTLAGG
jgi:vancomycin resistance protein VanJ